MKQSNHTKEFNKIRKNLAIYLEKLDVYYESAKIDNNQIINRKEVSGKLSAAKRFYNQAVKHRDAINLSESMWSSVLRDVQIEHKLKKDAKKFA
jgi:hypothetical protein